MRAGKIFIVVILLFMLEKSSFAQEYIGRAEAFRTVNICPEVSAKIVKVHFSEGSFIEEGQVLFSLDGTKFLAEVQLKKAQLSQAQANLDGAQKTLARLKAVVRRGVSASEVDIAETETKKAQAALEEARAELRLSQVDLNNTKIPAPISGYIGKAEFTKGSYVSPENILATIVQTDPVRVSFAMTDRDYLANRDKPASFQLILADGSTYPHKGTVDFVSNVMNPETGTITVWLNFLNENHSLIPGEIVRVRVVY